MKNAIYIGVTPDELELPLVVADNLQELSELTGLSKEVLTVAISSDKHHKNSGCKRGIRFRKIKYKNKELENE
jgi:hypothetical protein